RLEPFNQPRRNPEIWAWAEAAIALPGAADHPLTVQACLLLAFGGHARDNPPEAERWARRARELHDRLGLPLDPRLGIMLVYGAAYQDRIDEAVAACEEGIAAAAAIGPDADIDRAEALYQRVFLSMRQGTPDIALAEEALALSERLGNLYM